MKKDRKIGLALSGGGIEGYAHIGVLQALEELGIEPTYVIGTSSGSIVAALYAMGYNLEEITEISKTIYNKTNRIKFRRILKACFNYILYKRSGIGYAVDANAVEEIIDECAKKKNINKISDIKNIILGVVVVDLIKGQECVCNSEVAKEDKGIIYLDDISVGKAVRASMAFPGLYEVVTYKEYQFIDGGICDRLPTQVIKELGAEQIISVDFDDANYASSKNIENAVLRAMELHFRRETVSSRKFADVALKVKTNNTNIWKCEDIKDTIAQGYLSTMVRKEELVKLISD